MRKIERVSQRKKGDSGLKGFVCFIGDRVSQFQRFLSGLGHQGCSQCHRLGLQLRGNISWYAYDFLAMGQATEELSLWGQAKNRVIKGQGFDRI